MTEPDYRELMLHVLQAPRIYLAARTGTALVSWMTGYSLAEFDGGKSVSYMETLRKTLRTRFDSKYLSTSHGLGDILLEVTAGDDAKAFDVLADKIRSLYDANGAGSGAQTGPQSV